MRYFFKGASDAPSTSFVRLHLRLVVPFKEIVSPLLNRYNIDIPFAEVESTLLKTRQISLPPIPTTTDDIRVSMMSHQHLGLTLRETPFYRGLFTAPDGHEVAIFLSGARETLQARELHVDATFKCVPRPFKQLCSIHAVYQDHVSLQKGTVNK